MTTINHSQIQCPICLMEPVKTGRTMLLLKDDFCFIDMNDKAVLVINDYPVFTKTRLTLCILQHTSIPEDEIIRRAKDRFLDFLTHQLQLNADAFIIRITMLTYPQHFHVPPTFFLSRMNMELLYPERCMRAVSICGMRPFPTICVIS